MQKYNKKKEEMTIGMKIRPIFQTSEEQIEEMLESLEEARKHFEGEEEEEEENRCNVCGRPISELKPFSGFDNPFDSFFNGYFNGAFLVKNYRPTGPHNEEAERELKEYDETEYVKSKKGEKFMTFDDWLLTKYEKQEAEYMSFCTQAHSLIGSSWECRDCILLDEDGYFDKRWKRYKDMKNQNE